MSQMLKSSAAMAAATLTSRLLGMVREIVYANFMGNTWVASAFFLAFQVPNLFRRLLGEGALTAAFIPIFKQKEVRHGEAEMWRSANAVISGLVAASAVVTVAAVLGISLALTRTELGEKARLMLELLRLMFPYMMLVCLAAVFIGMANARGHFFVPALGAVILNVVMIASVLWLAPRLGHKPEEQIFGLAIGVVLAGVAQAFFQLPSLAREGFRYHWVSPWRDPTVREVVRKMLPGSIGVAAFQINVLVTQYFSFWFGDTIVATFNYSVRLMELPQGMFGISLATYLLPTLSALAAAKKYPEFRQTLNQGLSYLAFANLIAAAIALALAAPIVRLIFEHGKFGPDATQRVAVALACLAPGLLMFSMNNIVARAFYALDDIKIPMKISLVCLVLNLGFALWLVRTYREAGLGVANTLSATFNLLLLVYALRRKLSNLDLAELRRTLLVLVPTATLAGIVAALFSSFWEKELGHRSLPLKLGAVFVPGGIAVLLYWLAALGMKVRAASEMTELVLEKVRRSRKGASEG
ncbi:MAG TPA: murein biosynthesis integral membrane protein MurJ [Candidatus Binatia bacterium]|jgi:putative peptidoglycan lipid II flippase|nr:murein biosynthesis integral membrane protein MurJ [Candidatus Binatia bacterium]